MHQDAELGGDVVEQFGALFAHPREHLAAGLLALGEVVVDLHAGQIIG